MCNPIQAIFFPWNWPGINRPVRIDIWPLALARRREWYLYSLKKYFEKLFQAESKVTECSAIGDETVPTVKVCIYLQIVIRQLIFELSYNTPGDESVNSRIDNEPVSIKKHLINLQNNN